MKTLEQLGISPAPWEIDKGPDGWIIVLDAKGRYAATPDGYEETEAISNASLIAAAPDLYEALVAMLSYAEKESPFTRESGMPIAIDMARKAIKRMVESNSLAIKGVCNGK